MCHKEHVEEKLYPVKVDRPRRAQRKIGKVEDISTSMQQHYQQQIPSALWLRKTVKHSKIQKRVRFFFFLWVFFAQIFCTRLAVRLWSVLIDRDQRQSTKHQRLFCLNRRWNTQTQYSQPYKIESTWTIPGEEDLVWNNPFLENFITLSKWLLKWGEFKLCHKSHQLVKLTKDSFGALSKYSFTSVLSQSLKPLFLVCFVKLWIGILEE